MIIPIICGETDCPSFRAEVNQVSGINPPDLTLFYEAYNGSNPSDCCAECGCLGIAEDPIIEHEWEKKYYD